jgi:uncharacterized protein YbgA (DUF1722 family)/uncharacterized protein YbbK (DUF523 family)
MARINQDLASEKKPELHIKVGLSACLAGHEVRYNGGHCQSRLCLDELSQHFNYVTFCPEVAAGFGTPRPTMRLVGNPEKPTLTYTLDSKQEQLDLTDQLVAGFKDKLSCFAELDGYILMKNSPSCGLERIKVYQENGYPHEQKGQGIFTAALKERYPNLPVEEEGRLQDDRLYENFVLRVYAYHNFRHEVLAVPSVHKLIQFHSSYKYVLMAHNQSLYKELGKRLANMNKAHLDQILTEYQTDFMHALSHSASRQNHTNTLMHILGYLKKTVSAEARQDINDVILKYHSGEISLSTPLTLLKHYIKQGGSEYIRTQRYLQPYPERLGLANRI